jgi:hypothetical protein
MESLGCLGAIKKTGVYPFSMEFTWFMLIPPALIFFYYTFNNLDTKTGEKQKLCAFCRTYIPESAKTCKHCTKDQP